MPNQRKEGTTPTSLWLDANTRQLLDDLSKRMGMTRSGVIREAIKLMHSDTSSIEIRRLVKELSEVIS